MYIIHTFVLMVLVRDQLKKYRQLLPLRALSLLSVLLVPVCSDVRILFHSWFSLGQMNRMLANNDRAAAGTPVKCTRVAGGMCLSVCLREKDS